MKKLNNYMKKPDTYTQKLHFAKSIGYKSIADAIGDMGKTKFNDLFYTQNEVPVKMNGTKVITVKQLEGINDKYYLYADGSCYSTHFGGRFLTPILMTQSDNYSKHYAYQIIYQGKRRKLYVSRLMMFYFGKHNYQDIDDMPVVTFDDGNTLNFDINNLRFARKGEIPRKARAKAPRDLGSKIKDTKSNIFIVESLLKRGRPLTAIAKIFNCHAMSVGRFIKRNNIQKPVDYKRLAVMDL